MKKLAILPFRLGCSISELIFKKGIEFYLWLVEELITEKFEIYNGIKEIRTIPISIDKIENDTGAIETKFGIEFGKYEDADLLIIDVKNQYQGIIRGTILIHIAQAISAIINDNTNSNQFFVLLVKEIPPESDTIRQILEPYIKLNKVIIVSENGEIIARNLPTPDFFSEQYRIKLAGSRETPLELFERKMIRRLGHFHRRRSDGTEYCNRYFFDGSLCEKELPGLIQNLFINTESTTPSTFILYHCPMSPWLLDAIITLSINNHQITLDLHSYLSKPDGINLLKGEIVQDSKCILIVDMVDTGRTIVKLHEFLKDCSVEVISTLTVLSTEPTDRINRIREIKVFDGDSEKTKIKINYIMAIEQKRYGVDCPLCKLRIPYSNDFIPESDLIEFSKKDDFMMIPSYDQWEICFNAEVKREIFPPPHRKGIPNLIDYPNVLENHGAWIASKIKNRLDNEGLLAGVVIVSPDGGGSQLFTDYINVVLRKQLVRIPHNVIEFCSNDESDLEKGLSEWKFSNPNWYQSLCNSGVFRAVIMEEFNVTGITYKGLKKLLQKLGHTVVCFFPLNNLDPSFSISLEEPLFTLYEWKSYDVEIRRQL